MVKIVNICGLEWIRTQTMVASFNACLEFFCNSSTGLLLVINHIWQADLIFPTWSLQDVQSAASICRQIWRCQMLRFVSVLYLVAFPSIPPSVAFPCLLKVHCMESDKNVRGFCTRHVAEPAWLLGGNEKGILTLQAQQLRNIRGC